MAQAAMNGMGTAVTLDRIAGKVILASLVALVMLAAAGAGGAFLLKPAAAHAGRDEAHTPKLVASYAPLPAMNFTLTDGERLHELRLRVTLEMDPSVQPKEVQPFVPRIINAMTNRMVEVNASELRGNDGASFVKDAVMRAAGREIRPLKIRQVLVQEFLLR